MVRLAHPLAWVLPPLLLIAAGGCASPDVRKLADDVETLKKQYWQLQKQVAEQGLVIAYHGNDIALLKERVKAAPLPDQPDAAPADGGENLGGMGGPDPDDPLADDTVVIRGTLPDGSEATLTSDVPAAAPEPEPAVAMADDAHAAVAPVVVAAESSPDLRVDPQLRTLATERLFEEGMTRFNGGDYQGAKVVFDYLVRRDPAEQLAPVAQYWVGECRAAQKRYAEAVDEYRKVLIRWPESPKVPDTLLKIGLTRLRIGDDDEGKRTLDRLVEQYPQSAAAAEARRLAAPPADAGAQ